MAIGEPLLTEFCRRCLRVLLLLTLPVGLGAQVAADKTAAEIAVPLTAYEITSVRLDASGGDNTLWKTENSGVTMANTPLLYVLKSAYEMSDATDDQITGLPGWAKTERFDISGKVAPEQVALYGKQDKHQKAVMLRSMLVDRFKLAAHEETKQGTIYVLVIAKSGLKVVKSPPLSAEVMSQPKVLGQMGPGSMTVDHGHMEAMLVPMTRLASLLSHQVGHTVIDSTEAEGLYSMKLDWTPAEQAGAADASSAPELFTALEEQLGLKLEARKAPVPVLVIDHLEQPAAN